MTIPVLVCDQIEHLGRNYSTAIVNITKKGIRLVTLAVSSDIDLTGILAEACYEGLFTQDMTSKEIKDNISKTLINKVSVFVYTMNRSKIESATENEYVSKELITGIVSALRGRLDTLLDTLDNVSIVELFADYVHRANFSKAVFVKRDVRRLVDKKTGSEKYLIMGDYFCLSCGDHVMREDVLMKKNGRVRYMNTHLMTCDTCGVIEREMAKSHYKERPVYFNA